MNADGSDIQHWDGVADFEIFNISPVETKIYFTKELRLTRTAQ